MSKVILLKQNSPEIRQKIRDAGLDLCHCAEFVDSDWLDFYPSVGSVHGSGYPFEGMTKEETRSLIKHEWKEHNFDVIDCKDVEEFIQKVKECLA